MNGIQLKGVATNHQEKNETQTYRGVEGQQDKSKQGLLEFLWIRSLDSGREARYTFLTIAMSQHINSHPKMGLFFFENEFRLGGSLGSSPWCPFPFLLPFIPRFSLHLSQSLGIQSHL